RWWAGRGGGRRARRVLVRIGLGDRPAGIDPPQDGSESNARGARHGAHLSPAGASGQTGRSAPGFCPSTPRVFHVKQSRRPPGAPPPSVFSREGSRVGSRFPPTGVPGDAVRVVAGP